MREIRFRAWDTQARRMLDGGGMQMNATTGILEHLPTVIIMQYTGLHDSKGIEIYEGDIIRAGKDNPRCYPVVFAEGSFAITKPQSSTPLRFLHDAEIEDNKIWYEVIGNIYESSDLLEVKP